MNNIDTVGSSGSEKEFTDNEGSSSRSVPPPGMPDGPQVNQYYEMQHTPINLVLRMRYGLHKYTDILSWK